MARKHNRESGEDDVKDERDRYDCHSSIIKMRIRSNGHGDDPRDISDSSNSDRKNRIRQDYIKHEVRIDDKHRNRARYREPGREESERSQSHCPYDQHEQQETEMDGQGVERSYYCSNEDGNQVENDRQCERTYEDDNGHKQRRTEDRNRNKERRACHYAEEEDERKVYRKSERRQQKMVDDKHRQHRTEEDGDNEKYHRFRDLSKQQEDGHGRIIKDTKPHKQSTMQEGNLAHLSGGV